MGDDLDYSTSNLEHCSYRYLQQLAKSMTLPSNVKKVYLIEMINAKKCSSESEVERIVKRVKQQRQHVMQRKKRSRQSFVQVDTDSETESPPISVTPKRPVAVRCNPELRQVIVRSQNSLLRPTTSDRVLRSSNIKSVKRPYMNHMLVEAAHCDVGTQMSTMRIVRKYKPNILSHSQSRSRQMVPVSPVPPSHVLMKRPRLLSGIYPIIKDMNFHIQSVDVRNRDGKISKINAYVHKPYTEDKDNQTKVFIHKTKENIETTLQDIINGNLDDQVNLQSLNYPNTSGVAEELEPFTELTQDCDSVYFHKKIRGEQVRERRMSALTTRCELPRIDDAFERFRLNNKSHDVTQPLYVEVSKESERILNYPLFASCNTNLLETVYNFKGQFLTTQPLLQIATTSNTKMVYSATTIATAVPHKPTPVTCTEPYMAFEQDSQYQCSTIDSSRMNDCLRLTEQDFDFRCNEEPKSSSSQGTALSQDLGANVTISDMVEDALELISQDGDYMERMGMDVRMQCVLCNWAGPKIILEYHIRKEHPNEIDKQEKRDWNISYSLGSLVSQVLWTCRVIEHDSVLYVLSVKFSQPDRFMATISSLSPDLDLPSASITIFNKLTGAPHSWAGAVRGVPPNLPYDNEPNLTLDLAGLNLLPNSASLKLVNGQLVLQSPNKVIFGQELNDIHIILFVKIFT